MEWGLAVPEVLPVQPAGVLAELHIIFIVFQRRILVRVDGSAPGLWSTGELIVMISGTRVISGGIILLLCLACVLPALALELNPLAYILRQPTPAPAVTRTDVREAVTMVPVQTMTPVPYLTISPVNDVIAPATPQTSDGVTLEGTITEVAYAGDYDLGFAFLELSDGSGVVLLVSDTPADDLMYDLFRTAYLKGNLVKAYTDNPVKKMEILGFNGPGEYVVYSIDSFDLGPVHPA